MCEEPAKMCKFDHRKGKLAKGFDADFCIWDPSAEFTVCEEMIHFRNKANPYMGQRLRGLVHATIVRGQTNNRRNVQFRWEFFEKGKFMMFNQKITENFYLNYL